MKRILCLLGCTLFLVGCATLPSKAPVPKSVDDSVSESGQVPPSSEGQEMQPIPKMPASEELKRLPGEALDGYVHTHGVVFAKVWVQGLLKSDFINLLIEDVNDPSHQFQLFIGDKVGSNSFPWEGPNKDVGHFFIELPKGEYVIRSIGIPVGSTMATEPSDVLFNVVPGQIAYLGTLKLEGTKEKVRLGGVPVIKPGFEYKKEVIDEREEARKLFYKRYPNFQADIVENLMVVPE